MAEKRPFQLRQAAADRHGDVFPGAEQTGAQLFRGGAETVPQGRGPAQGRVPAFYGVVHVLATLREKEKEYLKNALKLAEDTPVNPYGQVFNFVGFSGIQFQLNNFVEAADKLDAVPIPPWNGFSTRLPTIGAIGHPAARSIFLKKHLHNAAKHGYH